MKTALKDVAADAMRSGTRFTRGSRATQPGQRRSATTCGASSKSSSAPATRCSAIFALSLSPRGGAAAAVRQDGGGRRDLNAKLDAVIAMTAGKTSNICLGRVHDCVDGDVSSAHGSAPRRRGRSLEILFVASSELQDGGLHTKPSADGVPLRDRGRK